MPGIYRVAFATLGFSASFFAFAALGAEPDAAAQAAKPQAAPTQQERSQTPAISEQRFGQWSLQCSSDHSMNPPCQVIYRLASADQKQIATVISMAKANGGTVGMQLALPLGFAIQGGVQIAFGPTFSMSAAVSRCTAQGCLIEGVAPENLLAAMLKEKSGQITLHMLQGNNIVLPIDLDGFASAYRAMSAKS
jgi:invasion protein IalB